MTTLWVETLAGYLTEGLQVSEDPASSEDRSRAHLFREWQALREHPLPHGPAPSSSVCVPKFPDFQPRLASPDVDFYSLLTKLRVAAVVLADAAARRAAYYSKGESGRRLLAPPADGFSGALGLPQASTPRPDSRKAMVARPCRNGPRNHGDPSSGRHGP
jgi:hypothetical protein